MTRTPMVKYAKSKEDLRFIRDRMDNDIKVAMKGKAIFLSILGLSAYTEILGGLIRNKFGNGESGKNYKAGLRKMGAKYEELLDNGCNLYDIIRCGLVHEFFVKKTVLINPRIDPPTDPGLRLDPKGMKTKTGYVEVLEIGIENYYRDFNRAFEGLISECEG